MCIRVNEPKVGSLRCETVSRLRLFASDEAIDALTLLVMRRDGELVWRSAARVCAPDLAIESHASVKFRRCAEGLK